MKPGPVLRAFDRDVPVLMRLERPVVALLGRVLSAEECAHVIALSRNRLRLSTAGSRPPLSPEDVSDLTAFLGTLTDGY